MSALIYTIIGKILRVQIYHHTSDYFKVLSI